MFYEDINQNIEVIKPENVISLEKNTNKGIKNSRNVEINTRSDRKKKTFSVSGKGQRKNQIFFFS